MFKTIHDCRLELVGHSVMVSETYPIRMLEADSSGDKDYALLSEQNADYMPCSAARASFGNEDKTGQDEAADRKLMKYLADHKHMTPFQHQTATFLVECPLFVAREWMRHRTQSFNEISRRYTSENVEFWVPDNFRGQSTNNRQASSDVLVDSYQPEGEALALNLRTVYLTQCEEAFKTYELLLAAGVAREQARAVLPQSMITRFFVTSDLRNWAHWYHLRVAEGAQEEIRIYAKRVSDLLVGLWPNSWKVLRESAPT